MLTYKFLHEKENEAVFAYYPNGNVNAPGKVAFSKHGKGRILEESKEDFGKRYAYHAIRQIDINKKQGTIAWY